MSDPASLLERLDELVTQFPDNSAAVVAQCVAGLRAAGAVSEEPLVALLLQSTTPVSLRLDACLASARIELEQAERTLVTLVDDEDPSIRAEAAMSVGLLAAVDALPQQLATRDRFAGTPSRDSDRCIALCAPRSIPSGTILRCLRVG